MAIIKVLKDEELVGGISDTDVYPVTHTKAIYDPNNKQLDTRLNENDEDRSLLHRESERVVAYIETTPTNGSVMEITEKPNKVEIKGWGKIENFGDEPPRYISTDGLENYYEETALPKYKKGVNDNLIYSEQALPNTVGKYTFKTEATVGEIEKSATSTIAVNLRKYFGFLGDTPSDVASLGTNHFSNSIGCTVTIPPINNGYQPIFFAIPSNMTISRVVQPDALNAPLAISYVTNKDRKIGDEIYTYKVYKSNDKIDTTNPKRLTIS